MRLLADRTTFIGSAAKARLPRSVRHSLSGLRTGLAVAAVGAGVLGLAAGVGMLEPDWVHTLTIFLLLVMPISVLAERFQGSNEGATGGAVPESGHGAASLPTASPSGNCPTCTACTGDCAVCSAAAAVRSLVPSGASQPGFNLVVVAGSLVRQMCNLVEARSAWVFRVAEGGPGVHLLASYPSPSASNPGSHLHQGAVGLARAVARKHAGGGSGVGSSIRTYVDGDYAAVPLICQGRLGAVVVLHGNGPRLEAEATESDQVAVSEAVVALENALLYESQRETLAKLQQLAHHRTDYVATVSHELRTPLTSIKGFAQLLMRAEELPENVVQSYASTIAAEAARLTHIVNDIIDLTRMETGLLALRREPICTARLIQGAVQSIQPAGSPLLKVDLPGQLPAVRGDAERLSQVLRWIVADGLQRAASGSGILLAAEAGEEAVRIRVEYRAAAAQIESLSRALQGPNHMGPDGQATKLGRGRLGLYISKNFIEAHGGRMWVERSGDSAARIVFTLPY